MKPYFAKYLPVEGEIKDGDTAIDPNNHVGIRLDRPYHYKWVESGKNQLLTELEMSNMKKAKLFLCSRDKPQHGDKIFCLDEMEHPKDGWRTFFSTDTCQNDVKVIGEISPEATWVKEGDEFGEDEVEEWWGQSETHYPMIKKLTWDGDTTDLAKRCPTVYKIKGSQCGHFH